VHALVQDLLPAQLLLLLLGVMVQLPALQLLLLQQQQGL
jgi:hypothetical protein